MKRALISSSAANAFPRAPPAAMIVSRLGPENAPSSDIFGHNRQRRCFHENDGGHNDFGVAHDIGSSHFGSDPDRRSERDANYRLKSLWGGGNHAFSGSIPETDQRAGCHRGLPDRLPGFGGRHLQFRAAALREQVISSK
jgi:hypothetical protein